MSNLSKSNFGRKKNGCAKSHNSSGLTGAFQASGRDGYGKWISRIRINGKAIQLRNKEGKTYFHSAAEAHEAYIEACLKFGINLSI